MIGAWWASGGKGRVEDREGVVKVARSHRAKWPQLGAWIYSKIESFGRPWAEKCYDTRYFLIGPPRLLDWEQHLRWQREAQKWGGILECSYNNPGQKWGRNGRAEVRLLRKSHAQDVNWRSSWQVLFMGWIQTKREWDGMGKDDCGLQSAWPEQMEAWSCLKRKCGRLQAGWAKSYFLFRTW